MSVVNVVKCLQSTSLSSSAKSKVLQMDSSSFYEACLEKFECIVCYQYMHPPIRQCILGHNYCNDCYLRMNTCPMCRSPHAPRSNGLMEKFHEHIRFPCKFKDEGCPSVVLSKEMLRHERGDCIKNWKFCPFNTFAFCTWFGPKNAELEHCREIHGNYISVGPRFFYQWKQFAEIDGGVECLNFLVFAFNAIFHCMLKVNARNNKFKISVDYLGNQEKASKYCFECRLALKSVPGSNHVIMAAPCGSTIDNKRCSVKMHYHLVKRYCGKTLTCKIRIIKSL